MSIFGDLKVKSIIYNVMTQSRELTNYCQESVRPNHSRRITEAFNQINKQDSINFLASVASGNELFDNSYSSDSSFDNSNTNESTYNIALQIIESNLY